MRGEAMPTVTRQPSGERWSNADLLFLASALDQGMSVAETTGFLNRGIAPVDVELGKEALPTLSR